MSNKRKIGVLLWILAVLIVGSWAEVTITNRYLWWKKLHSPHKELMMLVEPFGMLVIGYVLIAMAIICLLVLPFWMHYSRNQKEV
ncbi:MAG: hypothetical protein AAB482_03880 [Patescibacteria group bacterium]